VTGWTPPARDPFVDLADDAVHEAAVRARAEQRDREQRAAEVATWVGTLHDLAERRAVVILRTRSARAHRGALVGVGLDHVVIRLRNGASAMVALEAMRSVRPEPGQPAPPAMGDRDSDQARTMVEWLARLAEERRTVVVVLRDVDEPLQGEVIGLGEDVVTLRLLGADRGTVYLPIAALDEIVLDR
jgi:ribosomal protein L27